MKETIGSKGGSRDRRRSFGIRKKKKIEEENELKELEKRVKKQQQKTFFFVVPLIIIGTIAKALVPIKKEQREEKNPVSAKKQTRKTQILEEPKKELQNEKIISEEKKKEYVFPKEKIEKDFPIEKKKELEEKLETEITKVKSNKIVQEYEDKLKEIRRKLRNIYFESDIIDDIKFLEQNPSEENLEKLNELIEKIENLKEKVKKEEKIEIEEDYLSVLVEEDIEKLENHKKVQGIEHSDILITISDTIQELKKKESKVAEKIEKKKQIENVEEEVVESRKEKAQDISAFQNDFVRLQNEQDEILSDIERKIKKDIPEIEKMQMKINAMQLSSTLVLRRIKRQIRIPGVRSGKRIVNLATSFLYYNSLFSIMRPRKVRYKNMETKDYRKELETNIQAMDDVLTQISKTTSEIEKVIHRFTEEYKAFRDSKEYLQLLKNLQQMKKALEEKEFEIKKQKLEQEKRLEREKNPAKVYSR